MNYIPFFLVVHLKIVQSINSLKLISMTHRMAPVIIHTIKTIINSRCVSSREGQLTFLSSEMASEIKLNLFLWGMVLF